MITQQDLDEGQYECPMCAGNDNELLGHLGNRAHLRCRCCGWRHYVTEGA